MLMRCAVCLQMLWSTICRALLGEMRRVRQGHAPILQGEAGRVDSSLDRIMAVMGILSRTSQLMGECLLQAPDTTTLNELSRSVPPC